MLTLLLVVMLVVVVMFLLWGDCVSCFVVVLWLFCGCFVVVAVVVVGVAVKVWILVLFGADLLMDFAHCSVLFDGICVPLQLHIC